MVKYLKINPTNPNHSLIQRARDYITDGKLVVFPTDTVYGLATNPFDKNAVRNLLKAKRRDPNKGLPILVASIELARDLVEFTPIADALTAQFWPGALTLVLPLKKLELKQVTGNRSTLGIRVPNHIIAQLLAEAPIIGTSANLSGQNSPITAQEAINQLGSSIDLALDSGPTPEGLSSTIIDLSQKTPQLLREGSIKYSQIQEFLW